MGITGTHGEKEKIKDEEKWQQYASSEQRFNTQRIFTKGKEEDLFVRVSKLHGINMLRLFCINNVCKLVKTFEKELEFALMRHI